MDQTEWIVSDADAAGHKAKSEQVTKTMQPFTTLTANAMPLRMENVDTDQIIPAKYLTAVTKEGMGKGLFSWIRYNPDGSPKPTL
jgi:hypothetical protein